MSQSNSKTVARSARPAAKSSARVAANTKPKAPTKAVPTALAPVAKKAGAAKPLTAPAKPGMAKTKSKSKAESPVSLVSVAPSTASTASATNAPRRRSGNKRSEQTVENILKATEVVVLKSGADRISILEVCETADVSRGTFYRYFASQEELLDAFAKHRRETFHRSMAEAVAHCTDPDERLATLLEHMNMILEEGSSRRMLLVAPAFAFSFFKRIFHDSVVRFQDLLAPVFEAWDARLGTKLDRELVCELIVRFMMSEHLVGDATERAAMPRRITRLVESLQRGAALKQERHAQGQCGPTKPGVNHPRVLTKLNTFADSD
jgi:AcrR family transcriptional regulator